MSSVDSSAYGTSYCGVLTLFQLIIPTTHAGDEYCLRSVSRNACVSALQPVLVKSMWSLGSKLLKAGGGGGGGKAESLGLEALIISTLQLDLAKFVCSLLLPC